MADEQDRGDEHVLLQRIDPGSKDYLVPVCPRCKTPHFNDTGLVLSFAGIDDDNNVLNNVLRFSFTCLNCQYIDGFAIAVPGFEALRDEVKGMN